MSWTKSGTVAVTNGQKKVFGTSTTWVANGKTRAGDAFIAPNGASLEVESVQSNTELTLVDAYLGPTAAGQAYKIQHLGLLPSELAIALSALQEKYLATIAQLYEWETSTAQTVPLTNPATGVTSNVKPLAAFIASIGTMGTQNKNSVDITGGKINGTQIGGDAPAAGAFTTLSASGNVTLGDALTDTLNVGNGGIIKDANGQVGVGVTPSAHWSSIKAIEVGAAGNSLLTYNGADTLVTNNVYWTALAAPKYARSGVGASTIDINNGSVAFLIAPSGTAGNPITWNQAMTLDASGNFLVGTTSAAPGHAIQRSVLEGNDIIEFKNSAIRSFLIQACAGTGYSYSPAVVYINKNSVSGRSINAAGTIQASGSDYAEYMLKATCWAGHKFAKGDIVGINAAGQLTPKFSEAVSFRVKTTNPSFVGGDDWFKEQRPEEPHAPNPELPDAPEVADANNLTDAEAKARAAWQAKCEQITAAAEQAYRLVEVDYLADLASFELRLEAARQNVERIMICGQAPVNVTGAKPGDWIVPVEGEDGMIVGVAVRDSEITFAQHRRAVGQVIAIEADGRPRIIK